MKEPTIFLTIQSTKFPLEIARVLPYPDWGLLWYSDMSFTTNSSESWDNEIWLDRLFLEGSEQIEEFKRFVKEGYPEYKWKKVLKEFKKLWKTRENYDNI